MSKMMSKMGGMSMGSTSMGSNAMSSKSSFSSSSSSSFSSSSSSSMMSSELGGGMPPMRPPPEMNHKVQKTEDYVPPSTTQTVEATVLLKVKEGEEYKLALNMQQYSPEDITIKLNGQELTIGAASH